MTNWQKESEGLDWIWCVGPERGSHTLILAGLPWVDINCWGSTKKEGKELCILSQRAMSRLVDIQQGMDNAPKVEN